MQLDSESQMDSIVCAINAEKPTSETTNATQTVDAA